MKQAKHRQISITKRLARNLLTIVTGALILLVADEARAQFPNTDSLEQIASVTPGSRLIKFHDEVSIPAYELFPTYSSRFGLGVNDEMVVVDTSSDTMTGFKHYRFQQYHKGLKVEGGEYLVRERLGRCENANGFILTGLDVPGQAMIQEEAALSYALESIGALTYLWEIPAEETMLQEDEEDTLATYFPTAELVINSPEWPYNPNFSRLTYKFKIAAARPYSRDLVYIDAITGATVTTQSLIQHSSPATAVTLYDGTQSIETKYVWHKGSYKLKDETRGKWIRTKDAEGGESTSDANHIWHGDTYWESDAMETQAHWAIEMAFDYFKEVHGISSYGDDDEKVKVYVNWSESGTASWNGEDIRFGTNSTPWVSLNTAGHEFTHGVDFFHNNLSSVGEANSLDESFGDIFGTCMEWWLDPANADWLHGEDQSVGGVRNLGDPNSKTDPDTYEGNFWDPTAIPHNDGCVQSYAFYLICEGGSGINDNGASYDVSGIGVSKGEKIAFKTLTKYITSLSQYVDARDAWICATAELYGVCSEEYKSVVAAWNAVGVSQTSVYESRYVVSGGDFCTSNNMQLGPNFYIYSGADMTAKSPTQIRIVDEFHAENGSEVTISIGCCY